MLKFDRGFKESGLFLIGLLGIHNKVTWLFTYRAWGLNVLDTSFFKTHNQVGNANKSIVKLAVQTSSPLFKKVRWCEHRKTLHEVFTFKKVSDPDTFIYTSYRMPLQDFLVQWVKPQQVLFWKFTPSIFPSSFVYLQTCSVPITSM